MSDTPRADAAIAAASQWTDGKGGMSVEDYLADEMRTLERELAAVTAERDALRDQLTESRRTLEMWKDVAGRQSVRRY